MRRDTAHAQYVLFFSYARSNLQRTCKPQLASLEQTDPERMQPAADERVSLSGSRRADTARVRTGKRKCSRLRSLSIYQKIGLLIFTVIVIVIIVIVIIGIVIWNYCPSREQIPHTQNVTNITAGQKREIPSSCGEGWVLFIDKCFYFTKEEGNWPFANNTCSTLRSSLALIDNEATLDFMKKHKGDFDRWIGLMKGKDGIWRWSNGSVYGHRFPIHGSSDCAYLNENGLSSARCTLTRHFACYKKRENGRHTVKHNGLQDVQEIQTRLL
ncbi:C-type lectin domain family 2 member B-like isoform X1 [Ambystoma mexicanum]|uniref:C-type lectin domain family 2 member B-like isoform X1 n=1 Tax=Ambystoma mexicanum TaxID=8296 RepID=UPI0037E8A7F7